MMADEMSPRRLERIGVDHDILERAKKALIDDDMTYEDYDECISLLIAEVERLRSLNESLMENGNDLRTRCQKAEARIKELESEITAWIADRDSWIARYEAVREASREMAELMAREALEIIKEGGKDE